jgi:hypothetical protein
VGRSPLAGRPLSRQICREMEASFFLVSFPVAPAGGFTLFFSSTDRIQAPFRLHARDRHGLLGPFFACKYLRTRVFFSSLSLFGGDDACFASSPSRRLALASSVARTCTVARAPRGIF